MQVREEDIYIGIYLSYGSFPNLTNMPIVIVRDSIATMGGLCALCGLFSCKNSSKKSCFTEDRMCIKPKTFQLLPH